MIYMLNLVFNASDTNATKEGRFQEPGPTPSTSPFLVQSHLWLQPSADANNPPQPDTESDWQFYQLDSAGPIEPSANDQVWIRILGVNAGGFVARVTVIVARSAARASHNAMGKPYQTRASPFVL